MQIFIHCKVLLMMGAVTPETCRVTLQWIKICILLHLVGFLLTLNCDARNHELKKKKLRSLLLVRATFFLLFSSCAVRKKWTDIEKFLWDIRFLRQLEFRQGSFCMNILLFGRSVPKFRINLLPRCFMAWVNNEAPGSSETLIAIYQTTSYHVPQDHHFGKGLVGPSASLFNLRKYLTDFDEVFFQVYVINNNNNM